MIIVKGICYLLVIVLGITLILPTLLIVLIVLGVTNPKGLLKVLKEPKTWKPL